MGGERRLSAFAVPGGAQARRGLALLLVLATGACADEPAEETRRRELLRAPDVPKLRAERKEQARIASDAGELLESDEIVAGVRLPRGFTLRLGLEHEWYYRSSQVTFEQLDRYFQSRLFTARVERSAHTVRYDAARPKDENAGDAPFVTVRVGAAPGDPRAQEIYIRRSPPSGRFEPPPEAQVRAEIEAAQKIAE